MISNIAVIFSLVALVALLGIISFFMIKTA